MGEMGDRSRAVFAEAYKTVGSIYAQLPPGVSLTSFFDCCHSGSLSRFAVGPAIAPPGSNLKARYVIMRQQWYDRYVARNPLRMAVGARDMGGFREAIQPAILPTS